MRKKVYGQNRNATCVFCGQQGTGKNKQGLPICRHHSQEEITLTCVCGEYLDVKESKYGTYFVCLNCGNISFNKGLEMNNLPLKSFQEI